MRYTYEIVIDGIREDITTRIEEVFNIITKASPTSVVVVNVTDNSSMKQCFIASNRDELEEWYECACQAAQWSSSEDKIELRAKIEKNMAQTWEPFNEAETDIHMRHAIPFAAVGMKPVSKSLEDDINAILTLGQLKVEDKDHINPSHYQDYCQDLQWLEAMQYLPHFREPKAFLAAVELQVRKYLDRSGGKDKELQETEKALWYLKFMTAYMKNGYKPIRVKDVDSILAGK